MEFKLSSLSMAHEQELRLQTERFTVDIDRLKGEAEDRVKRGRVRNLEEIDEHQRMRSVLERKLGDSELEREKLKQDILTKLAELDLLRREHERAKSNDSYSY